MADKNITLRQKNTSGEYDKLYTKTTATQSKLSAATAALFGNNVTDADAALSKVANAVKTIGDVRVKVVDPNGNPIQGARITGLYGTPTTASDGTTHGVLQTNPISISSPYIDLKDQTANASRYVGSFDTLTVTLPIVGENNVKRITSSQTVKFKLATTVDVCCVGGGGGGNAGRYHSGSLPGAGGGGGGIANDYAISIDSDTEYDIVIGSGGIGGGQTGGTGGTTSFVSVSAHGGNGAYVVQSPTSFGYSTGGAAGTSGCGNGGDGRNSKNGGSNTSVSEFNDGVTFYSGGGGGGNLSAQGKGTGGAPNGADGSYIVSGTPHHATDGGIGGGGGGGVTNSNGIQANASAGGSGLVAIRFHF